MRDNYFFTLINPRKRYYTLAANIILLINFCLLVLGKLQPVVFAMSSFYYVTLVIFFLLFIIRFYFLVKYDRLRFTNLHFGIIVAIYWYIVHRWDIALAVTVLAVFEYMVNKDTDFYFTPKGIKIQTIPTKTFSWQQLQNVIMKDGLLTIDQKNNKLFQVDVSDTLIPFTEIEFAQFVANNMKQQ